MARATTSAEAWSILARTFHAQTGSRRMHLRQQLQTLSKGLLSILDYFQKKHALVDSLSDWMCVIPNANFVAYILYGPGSQYSAFHSTLSMRVDPFSFHKLLRLLQHEEQRLEEDAQTLSPPCANVANHKGGGQNSQPSTGRYDQLSIDCSSTDENVATKPKIYCQI